MYCATPDGSGCGCGGACEHGRENGGTATLGLYYGYTSPDSGIPTSFGFPDWIGDVWSIVRGELGDAAGDLSGEVVEWIKRRIGQEAWERMPDSSRREVVRQAAAEATDGLLTAANAPWLLAGGAVLLFALARR